MEERKEGDGWRRETLAFCGVITAMSVTQVTALTYSPTSPTFASDIEGAVMHSLLDAFEVCPSCSLRTYIALVFGTEVAGPPHNVDRSCLFQNSS